jgi:3-phosphoshikimate 1-carboxyvinyltransferase
VTDPLPIKPFTRKPEAVLRLPGSKSITNRALVLGALAEGHTRLEGALFSRDTRILLDALAVLGFACEADETAGTIAVSGRGGSIPLESARIDVGNAGTAARFLTALLALRRGGSYHLDGDPAMRTRPMAGLLNALRKLGAAEIDFHGEAGHFPFTLHGRGFEGGSVEIDATASSQMLSALLLAGPAGGGALELKAPGVRVPYVELTLKLRQAFGAGPVAPPGPDGGYQLPPTRYRPPAGGGYQIEPDISAASYFLALVLVHGGRLEIPNLGPDPLQGDAHFVEVLAHHGLEVDAGNGRWLVRCHRPQDIRRDEREIDFHAISDTFLTYAAIAPLLGDPVRITGIGHTRGQETDRIAGMARELAGLGQLVKEEEDALTIGPKPNELRARALDARRRGRLLEIETYEDHRFAMSFAVLGSFDLLDDGLPWLAVRNPTCCGKTFPRFFDELDRLRRRRPEA